MAPRSYLPALVLLALAPFACAREFRAAWVASVYNLNFPSSTGLSEEQQKAEIRFLVRSAAQDGLNALMVQVRPEGDALYASHLEPWSRYLTGTQGASPGYDPLEYFVREGAKAGVGIHAWINPYRAATNASAPRARLHESYSLRSSLHRVGSSLWMDPGDPAVQEHVVRVARDLVRRYAIAGLILDDYFYPYPGNGYARGTFPDRATYSSYLAGRGKLAIDDWRRENVNRLVRDLHAAVKSARPAAQFGVSPFGIYTRGEPPEVSADLDQLHDLYADPVAWLKNRWVDYISPQLYWRDAGAQSFSTLLRWWRSVEVNPHSIPVYPSIALERMGAGFGWPSEEIQRQLTLESSIKPRESGGFILWNVGQLMRNQKGVASIVAALGRAE
jgi:uncharacterized lipoprotein YddW (UPF0748 family)